MTHEEYKAWKAERYPLWDKLRKMGKWKGDYHYLAPDALRELIAKFAPPPKAEAKPKPEAKKPKAKKSEDVSEIVAKDEKCLAIIEDAKKAKAEGNAEKLAELKAALEARIVEIKAA